MSAEDEREFENAAGDLLADLGYETATPKSDWLPPEEWARSKSRTERGSDQTGSTRFRDMVKRD